MGEKIYRGSPASDNTADAKIVQPNFLKKFLPVMESKPMQKIREAFACHRLV